MHMLQMIPMGDAINRILTNCKNLVNKSINILSNNFLFNKNSTNPKNIF